MHPACVLLQSSDYAGVTFGLYIQNTAMDRSEARKESSRKYDAVVVPGGGVAESGHPRPWVASRLVTALELDTDYYIVLSRGTTHRPPPLHEDGFPVDESAASAHFLIQRGVLPHRILLDTWSLDTIGNAYFARAMVVAPLQLKKLCVVTSLFHMDRTRAIFEWVFALDDGCFDIDYCVSKDVGLTSSDLEARRAKELSSLETLRSITIPSVNSMKKLAQFLFQKHGAYRADVVSSHSTKGTMDTAAANSY